MGSVDIHAVFTVEMEDLCILRLDHLILNMCWLDLEKMEMVIRGSTPDTSGEAAIRRL